MKKGHITVVGLDRLDSENINRKITSKLTIENDKNGAQDLMEHLVSVCSHIGEGGGHWISYTRVGSRWFVNNDNNDAREKPHPFLAPFPNETVNMLFFINRNF